MLSTKRSLKCPVCKTPLGCSYDDEMFIGHCGECLAEFTWYPHEEVPSAQLDSSKRHKHCGCGVCQDTV
jgi:hypothetical protein